MNASVPMPVPRPLPWGRSHLLMLVALNALGAALILIAWYWSAGRAEAEMAPLNLAVLAMVVAGATNGAWLVRGRRAIGARRRAWLADLTGGSVSRASKPAPLAVAEPAAPAADDVVLVVRTEGALRFHRPGCALIADRPAATMARAAATTAGKIACGACRA